MLSTSSWIIHAPFRFIATIIYCLHSAISSPFLTSIIFRSSFILSAYLCRGHLLGLFMFSFHAVICPIRSSDLNTWSAQLIRALFKVPIMLGSLYFIVILGFYYFVFHILHHYFSLGRIFSSVSIFRKLLTIFWLILSCP